MFEPKPDIYEHLSHQTGGDVKYTPPRGNNEAEKFYRDASHFGGEELDPNGVSANTPGAKLDLGKSPIYEGVLQYFPRALTAVANLSGYGANKYSWKGWRKVMNGIARYSNALGRHILKEQVEGVWDLDAKNDPKYPADILHKTQIAWNALAALELYLEEHEGGKGK